ncbi:enoyl-CoA hydratase/isomerase family protein [Dactylosporangium roseum]|uniref:Enoyl-CoA hydratase/isomerase family protein n=1 Tax=Dactylosporangium roseum TaxID=47989 RepID=A0ABY5ZDK8_9ACTN|nr:enoyl-CoA hydratase-related protein [Dactylosporangium roseum]UWZ39043.1 enoyl-CoA hydratase/isomerase family protein [Dactylosporangium roseum]
MDTVVCERVDAVGVVRINRPQVRNALDPETLLAMTDALLGYDADPGVRTVLLTGTGELSFSAGMDLRAAAEGRLVDVARSPLTLLRGGYRKPVIAAVNGPAVGGGFELALACDLVVAAEHAYFALPEVGRGIAASEGGTDLPRRLPLAVALEVGLTTEPLPAARAYELGLVNVVVPAEEVLPRALALGARIATHSPAAVLATKRLMHLSLDTRERDLAAANRIATLELLAGPDAAEGAAAFVAKRPPRWADVP